MRFPSTNGDFELAGILLVPDNPPAAAVVLVSGSGPQDRDESIAGHRPFLLLADHLARNGIAVLRYDDWRRGCPDFATFEQAGFIIHGFRGKGAPATIQTSGDQLKP